MTAALCLNMIVKDEAAIIERMIDSVAAHLSYYVVCDTGSTDDTIERVRERFSSHGVDGEIHNIEFANFGQARNRALECARTSKGRFQYLLLADADMELIIDDPSFTWNLSKTAYSVKQESESLGYYNTRLIRADVPAAYIGLTHEYLDVSGVERLSGLRFLDHACGANRKDGSSRDTRLLLQQLEDDPNDARAAFYLAQTCRDAGRFQEAADWYQLRLRSAGSAEEHWYARYQLALCYLALSDTARFVSESLHAYSERPWRIEPLYQLARYHRLKDMPDAARLFLLQAQKIPYPFNDQLFIDETIFRTGMAEELSFAGLSSGESKDTALYELGRKSCFALSTNPKASPEALTAARTNSAYYALSAAEMFEHFHAHKIELNVEPGYCALNPSIAFAETGLSGIVRTSNFMNLSDGEIVRTHNVFVQFADDLSVSGSNEMVDRSGRIALANPVQGCEDCRLFRLHDQWFSTATVRDNDCHGLCEMALLSLSNDGSIENARILSSLRKGGHEKNWVPFVSEDQLFFIYKAAPTVILSCDHQTGELKELSVKRSKLALDHLRGGSQAIRIDGGWLYVTHEVALSVDNKRTYSHRFVLLDQDFAVCALTDPFYFLYSGIEYCAGLAFNATTAQLLVSLGVNDREAWIGSLSLESVLSRMHRA